LRHTKWSIHGLFAGLISGPTRPVSLSLVIRAMCLYYSEQRSNKAKATSWEQINNLWDYTHELLQKKWDALPVSKIQYASYHCITLLLHYVATLVHRLLSRNSASYLADDCHLVADAREWRLLSTENWTCVVTRTHSAFRDTAFAPASPGLWNSLAPHLRDADLPYSQFRRSPKTFLFGQWGRGTVRTILTAPSRNNLTYLLTSL